MDSSYILFKTYIHNHQAQLDLKKLESEGIDTYLTDENMGSYGFLGAATGGIKVHIAKEDLERAQEILSGE